MPRLVYLPSVVAKYAADSPKTAWELYQFINELVVGDAPELTEEEVANIKQWLLTVGQTAGAKGLALNMGSVVTTSPVFQEWAFHHLNGYLGEKQEPAHSQQAPSTTTPQGHQHSNFLEDVVRILLKNAGGNQGDSNNASSEKAEEKIKAYTQYEVAKLMGYARESDAAQLPYIWKLFKTTKETDDHRTNLHREMMKWSQGQGIAIDRSIFFSKETMEDIVKMRFNPVGLSATLTTCEKGVTNLLCLPRTAGEVEALKLFERAVEETMATRTLKEAEKLASSNKRDPPTDYFSLKVMVGTYAALLNVLFGEKCHLYEMMMKLYKILDLEEVFINRYAFDALKCKQITWAIFEDSRAFFWKKVSPLDLAEGRTMEGVYSMLDDIMADVRYGRNVIRSTFPLAWQDQANVYAPPTGLPPAPIPLATAQNQHNPMNFLSPYAGVFGSGFHVPPPPPPQTLMQKLAHVSKIVKDKFQEYHKKFGGRVLLSRLLQLGNIDIQKLPVVPELVDNSTGKNNLCYNYCLGVCPHGDNCHYKKLGGHVPGDKLPESFVTGLCQQIEPGIAAAMKLNPARPSQVLSGGPNQKKARR
jgi:hypothetical protein